MAVRTPHPLSRFHLPWLSAPCQRTPQLRHHSVQSKGVGQNRLWQLASMAQRRVQETVGSAEERKGKNELVKPHTIANLGRRRAISFCPYKRDEEYDGLATSDQASFFGALVPALKRGTISAVALPRGNETSGTGAPGNGMYFCAAIKSARTQPASEHLNEAARISRPFGHDDKEVESALLSWADLRLLQDIPPRPRERTMER